MEKFFFIHLPIVLLSYLALYNLLIRLFPYKNRAKIYFTTVAVISFIYLIFNIVQVHWNKQEARPLPCDTTIPSVTERIKDEIRQQTTVVAVDFLGNIKLIVSFHGDSKEFPKVPIGHYLAVTFVEDFTFRVESEIFSCKQKTAWQTVEVKENETFPLEIDIQCDPVGENIKIEVITTGDIPEEV
jgi:hypothetical protein